MFQSLEILRMARAYATHASTRHQAIAQNVANANTPGYRSRDAVSFTEYWQALQSGRTEPRDLIRLDEHPATTSPDGNTVSVEFEMMRAVEARQQHETALGISSSMRDLLRAAIGR